jgi:hypothetical protein
MLRLFNRQKPDWQIVRSCMRELFETKFRLNELLLRHNVFDQPVVISVRKHVASRDPTHDFSLPRGTFLAPGNDLLL